MIVYYIVYYIVTFFVIYICKRYTIYSDMCEIMLKVLLSGFLEFTSRIWYKNIFINIKIKSINVIETDMKFLVVINSDNLRDL